MNNKWTKLDDPQNTVYGETYLDVRTFTLFLFLDDKHLPEGEKIQALIENCQGVIDNIHRFDYFTTKDVDEGMSPKQGYALKFSGESAFKQKWFDITDEDFWKKSVQALNGKLNNVESITAPFQKTIVVKVNTGKFSPFPDKPEEEYDLNFGFEIMYRRKERWGIYTYYSVKSWADHSQTPTISDLEKEGTYEKDEVIVLPFTEPLWILLKGYKEQFECMEQSLRSILQAKCLKH